MTPVRAGTPFACASRSQKKEADLLCSIPRSTRKTFFLILVAVLFLAGFFWRPSKAAVQPRDAAVSHAFAPFSLFTDPAYSSFERASLIVVLLIAVGGLVYAAALVRQIRRANRGTPKMQAV